MTNLEDILVNIWDNNYTYEGLLEISRKMPNCTILTKGKGDFHNGLFDGRWNSFC